VAAGASSAPFNLSEYQKQTWQVEDGLPESHVRMISQRPGGPVLLATFSGVFTFDGQSFVALHDANTPSAYPDAVNAVIPGRNNDLWIGTDGMGVIHETGGASVNISATAGHSAERIRDLCFDSTGVLWIATQFGVQRYERGRLNTLGDVGIIGGDINTVFAEDGAGGMYFVTSNGFYHWRSGITTHMHLAKRLGEPTAALRDQRGQLWIGTSHAVLEADEQVTTGRLHTVVRAEVRSPVTALASDRMGNVWVGTKRDGLWRVGNDEVLSWTHDDGLPDNTVRSLFVDDEDNLWIGMLTGGLSRWNKASFAPVADVPGFSLAHAATTFADSHGDLWLGTWGQGLFRRHAGVTRPVRLPGMPLSTPIRAIVEDRVGRVWIGTWFNGIYCYDHGRLKNYRLGIESLVDAVSALVMDTSGGLWVGTYTGVWYFPAGIPERGRGEHFLASRLITDLIEDRNHSILAATTTGLFRIGPQIVTEIQELTHSYVLSLARDTQGNLYAAPKSGGLLRVDGDRGNRIPESSGLPMLPVYNAVEDQHGHLFFGTSRGVYRVGASELSAVAEGRSATLSAVLFGRADGMLSGDCSGPSRPSATRMADGTLYFATNRGFVHTTAFTEAALQPAPVAHITGWVFGNSSTQPSAQLTTGTKVIIDAGETDVTFYFSAKRLSNPARVEYRYRLAGYDSGWVVTHSCYARYRRIGPGTYRFEVQARNSGEPWTTDVAELAVRQKPHIYNTYTFYLFIALLAFALAAYLYSLRIRRVKGSMGIVLEERNRIARECHDTLMAGFAAVAWQLESTAKTLAADDKVDASAAKHGCDLARSMVSHCQAEARRIIWDLRDTNEVTGVLSQAIWRAIAADFRCRGIDIRIAIDGDEILLPPVSVHHLVCITQEAVSNALRHGRPSTITVYLRYKQDSLRVSIQDNGGGFVAENPATPHGHFGLLVMEERARKIGGRLHVSSSSHDGTEVRIDIPYAHYALRTRPINNPVIRWIGI
jgi:ligand-binding sensor domain-containing protein/signal transduction histidine kinase